MYSATSVMCSRLNRCLPSSFRSFLMRLMTLCDVARLPDVRIVNWRIPAAVLGAAFLLSMTLHFMNPKEYASPILMLFSGGLMLGALFMASDMVGSPMTNLGCWIYGVFIGVIAIVIRTWGAMPEGVMYAILLGNALSPQIDRMLQPRVYGTRAKEKAA